MSQPATKAKTAQIPTSRKQRSASTSQNASRKQSKANLPASRPRTVTAPIVETNGDASKKPQATHKIYLPQRPSSPIAKFPKHERRPPVEFGNAFDILQNESPSSPSSASESSVDEKPVPGEGVGHQNGSASHPQDVRMENAAIVGDTTVIEAAGNDDVSPKFFVFQAPKPPVKTPQTTILKRAEDLVSPLKPATPVTSPTVNKAGLPKLSSTLPTRHKAEPRPRTATMAPSSTSKGGLGLSPSAAIARKLAAFTDPHSKQGPSDKSVDDWLAADAADHLTSALENLAAVLWDSWGTPESLTSEARGHVCTHMTAAGYCEVDADHKKIKGKEKIIPPMPRNCCARCYAKTKKELIVDHNRLVRIMPDIGSGGWSQRSPDCISWNYPIVIDATVQPCYCPAGHGLNKDKRDDSGPRRYGPTETALIGAYDSAQQLFVSRFLKHDMPIYAGELALHLEHCFIPELIRNLVIGEATSSLPAAGPGREFRKVSRPPLTAADLRQMPTAECKLLLREKFVLMVQRYLNNIFFGLTCPAVLEELSDVAANHVTASNGIPCACLLSICKPCMDNLLAPGPVLPKCPPPTRRRQPVDQDALSFHILKDFQGDGDVEDIIATARYAQGAIGDAFWEIVAQVDLGALASEFLVPLLIADQEHFYHRIREAYEINPKMRSLYKLKKALTYQSVYDSISQQSIVNRALELSQADAKKRVARGISAFRRKSFELATMLFNQCCSLDPASNYYRSLHAGALLCSKKFKEARKEANRILSTNADDQRTADALLIRAHALICSAAIDTTPADVACIMAAACLSDLDQAEFLRNPNGSATTKLIETWHTAMATLPSCSSPRQIEIGRDSWLNFSTPGATASKTQPKGLSAPSSVATGSLAKSAKSAGTATKSSLTPSLGGQDRGICLDFLRGECAKTDCPDVHLGSGVNAAADGGFLSRFFEAHSGAWNPFSSIL